MVKRIDPGKAWDAYQAGHEALRGWLERLPEPEWARASELPGWTMADLAAHIGMVADSIDALSVAPRGENPKTIGGYVSGYEAAAESVADMTRAIGDKVGRGPSEILAVIDERFGAAVSRVQEVGLSDQVVLARRGPIRLGDFLLTRVIEIVVHADDFTRSLPTARAAVLPRDAQRLAVRALLGILAERAPGRTVEVRVPPHAAVQCVEGPRHTRGTPPNVVEMEPLTWIRLAAGRSTWGTEVESGRVAASGERADLSAHLPVF
ncbi:sterol carrier family protein [Phytoactinopolyspora mesophila]|uniref:sterol carrier family protein n=1 Tax=Phytoactinopolyspora mesophila TaxID=2650750 RepID=UPI001390DD03